MEIDSRNKYKLYRAVAIEVARTRPAQIMDLPNANVSVGSDGAFVEICVFVKNEDLLDSTTIPMGGNGQGAATDQSSFTATQ